MALRIKSTSPEVLLKKVKKGITDGNIETWGCTTIGNFDYFSHVTKDKQWVGKAWLRPSIAENELLLNIIRPGNGRVSSEAYAVYHGRFAEMILAHFDQDFTSVSASALPESGDMV